MSTTFDSDFGPKDPIRALHLAYKTGQEAQAPSTPAQPEGEPACAGLEDMGRDDLIRRLVHEMRAQSPWTLFFHSSLAERLHLNPTDHKCLDIIWRSQDESGECLTPGQLARETRLTTGAVTGVLDRLEQAGFVKREHDPADRRRIIVRPIPERIKQDVQPLFDWLAEEFQKLCARYSDEELRRMIQFSRDSQALLRHATDNLKELEGQS